MTQRLSDELAGTARLPVVVSVALSAFLAQSLLHYVLPLYFEGRGLPRVSWETWSYYEIVAWLFGPPLAGFLAGRLGERIAWSFGMFGCAWVGLLVALVPSSGVLVGPALGVTGLTWGVTSALIWVGGISLAQNVPENRKGLSNGLIMTSLGAGSIAGPVIGRTLVALSSGGAAPTGADFHSSLTLFSALSVGGGLLMAAMGQYPGRQAGKASHSTLRHGFALLKDRKYLLLVVSLSLLGGPVFQATNVYRPYRARDPEIGLIVGAEDHGWGALEISNYVMQLVGGGLIALVARGRMGLRRAALIPAGFAGCALGIGIAWNAPLLFTFSVGFEILRQFMRWIQTGYVAEHLSGPQRAAGIGLSVTLSGVGSWLFNLITRQLQSPDSPSFSSGLPFYIAAAVGAAGAFLLALVGERARASRPVTLPASAGNE